MGKDKALRESYYSQPCTVCRRTPSDPCHIRTYAVTREDKPDNLMPLCRLHHIEQGQIGWGRFSLRYPAVLEALYSRGWSVSSNGKLARCHTQ